MESCNGSFGKKTRENADHKANPTYAIIDPQSVKTTSASENRGIDGNKKIKGRKRHIIVDTMGNLLAVSVHAADIHDTKSGINPAKRAFEKYPTIQKFCGDDGYRKSFEEAVSKQRLCSTIIDIKKHDQKTRY